MKRSENIIAGLLVAAALVLCAGILLTSPSESTKEKKEVLSESTAQGHDMSSMDNQPDQDIGSEVDLTDQSEITMNIKNFKYDKPNIKIKKGTTVTWTNQDTIKHNVMLEHEGAGAAHDAPTPDEVDPTKLAGPLLAKGESYSFTFNEASEDPYHCSPHPYMKGKVTVVD